ncbi:MAG: hypothetical protein WED00_16415 [Aquisalimonadaceae bacterium]
MLRTTLIALSLISALSVSDSVSANGLRLDCEDGGLTSIEEVRNGETFSSVSYIVSQGEEGIFGTIMTMRYNDEDLPLGMIGDISGMNPASREKAITHNYERLVLRETFFKVSEVTAVHFNGRDYVRYDGATFEQDQHALFHVVAYDNFAKIALTRDVGGENIELLIAALDDSLGHCHLPGMTK